MRLLLGAQIGTYLALGLVFLVRGDWKLGAAQWLLAGVQLLLFG